MGENPQGSYADKNRQCIERGGEPIATGILDEVLPYREVINRLTYLPNPEPDSSAAPTFNP